MAILFVLSKMFTCDCGDGHSGRFNVYSFQSVIYFLMKSTPMLADLIGYH